MLHRSAKNALQYEGPLDLVDQRTVFLTMCENAWQALLSLSRDLRIEFGMPSKYWFEMIFVGNSTPYVCA